MTTDAKNTENTENIIDGLALWKEIPDVQRGAGMVIEQKATLGFCEQATAKEALLAFEQGKLILIHYLYVGRSGPGLGIAAGRPFHHGIQTNDAYKAVQLVDGHEQWYRNNAHATMPLPQGQGARAYMTGLDALSYDFYIQR